MAIGEVFLGAFVTVLLERLASREFLKFLRPTGISAHLKKWHRTLLIIKDVLTDAENKQTTNESIKEWLKDLEDLAYDLDDIVDELNTEALQRKFTENESMTSKVWKLIPTCCTNFKFDRRITWKLNDIGNRLEDVVKQISMLNLVENVRGIPYRKPERLQMTSLVEKSDVHGREKEKDDILNMLFEHDQSNDSPLTVIPIVGMGGIGKTTLAQLVYNEETLEGKFDIQAWACVSDEFDALRITKVILEAVSSERYDYVDLNMLQVKLKQNLSNKKFLIVLDDVWNEKCGDWDILRRPFLSGEPGSKIIVTTRQQNVAKMMSRTLAYHLNELSDRDALSLLAHHALEAKTFDHVQPKLREIGMSVVRRCKNLPLAVKAIGGILRMKTSAEEWEGVLNSEIWRSEENSEILPALKLSYQHLPPHLKQCFAYCAIYPKDYEYDKTELVYLWMAEGFLQQSRNGRLMEELGSDYFDELLGRSFFQKSTANALRFVMHDLINDLSVSVAGYKCLRLEDTLKDNLAYKTSGKVRRLSFISQYYESYDRFTSVGSFQSLRTFLPLCSIDQYPVYYLTQRILRDILPKLYCAREISLSGYRIYELPSNIGDLRHLRYFNLSRTKLRCLPESFSNLCNLEVLILEGCERLARLPARIENLTSLRHLNIGGTDELNEMPKGLARLTSLQTLSKMIVSKSGGLKIKDLRDFSLLKGEISIVELQNVVNVKEATDARLTNKPRLNEIRLQWSHEFDDSRDEILEQDVLEALKPHENLLSLEIKFYGGAKFSSWIGDLSFAKLTKIGFEFCKKCTNLPTLGQLPSLKDFRIQGMDGVKVIGTEFYGNVRNGELVFPSLENLTFEDMPEWEEWQGLAPEAQCVIEFPKLARLQIQRCPKLVNLPVVSLPSLHELSLVNCHEVILNQMHNLTSLTNLMLDSIIGLTSVSRAFQQFPLKLKYFEIYDCEDLVNLWTNDNIIQRVVNLHTVRIRRCPKLLSIQEIGVLPVIHTLEIVDCSSLEMMTTIQDCSSSLGALWISKCSNLNFMNLMGSPPSLQSYSNLVRLSISLCDGLESFPHGGLPTPNLKLLQIFECPNLKALPDQIEQLSSLEILYVDHCRSLTEPFPQVDLPPNLTHLTISDCGKLKPLRQWNLQKLTSLSYFHLNGGYPELVSFAEDDDNDQHYLLPPSLTGLRLTDMPNLENSKGFENLTSLRILWIIRCPKLVELPMEDRLDRLSSLWIKGCPLLQKRCLKSRRDYWPIIGDIPDVLIDGNRVHDPSFDQEQRLQTLEESTVVP